ncbi:DNA helicase [Tanacetum coccineum]|uniref:DNA helicase n=1 Tax=Tanacetum coccineum TaxID=301880 RepID=A0ABQ5CSY6_9ASTR
MKENVRLLRSGLNNEERKCSEAFSKCFLNVGMSEIIDFIYDEAILKTPTAGALQEKAIVCLNNDVADAVNAKILSSIECQSRTYLSNGEAIPIGRETSETKMLYPMKYLNTITFPGFLPHELQLKVRSPIMLLRNVNMSGESKGLSTSQIMQSQKMSDTTIASLRAGQENYILEAKNNAIQANMNINNIDYFNPPLKSGTVYRFSNFICEKTKPYHQTLENKVIPKFGKITRFDILIRKESEFLEHHFEFIAYNQLASKVPYRDETSKMIYLVLTDLQLTATPATHYYINPRIPEAEYAHTAQCIKGLTQQNGTYTCEDHGKQDPPTYRYNFKATVTDTTGNAQFTANAEIQRNKSKAATH